MRLFADYHHADLYESLLLLFEDRFGWEVYRPTGREWFEEGLWKYSYEPGVIDQFLGPWPDQARRARDYQTAHDIPHPDRVHRLVTLEEFRSQRWDYILASVTQHEQLYHDLAAEIGARSILQVGNVNQPVDWGLSHLVLAAAKIELQGPGVIYHPEFSLDDYRHEPITNPKRIVNLMNCLPDAGQAYQDWLALQEALPDFEFREYGILGKDGILGPSARIAEEMRGAGWAFHDKPQGDGYGFVIHQWAASGRPLLGRASYYKGKLAEPFWHREDRTSFNLDYYPIDLLAKRIRDRTGSHQSWMGDELHQTFLREIDFDAEAERIKELLT